MSKKNILLIEDESSIADTIKYSLTAEGFNPIWAITGDEGLKIFKNNKIDLIIIDIGLPDINGFELIKIIRKDSSAPIICLTARAEEIDKVLGLELGSDDYMTKPFSPRELAARVKANLRRSNDEFNAKASNDNFVIDENKKQISFKDTVIELSYYEYKILSLLIKNPGKVYAREKIIEIVWGAYSDIYDRTIDAHIKAIRSKIRAVDENSDPIETHRGFGYSLKEKL